MILSTHAVVGGAIASLVPSNPVLAAVTGFASHFAIDAIPHWDYPLPPISISKGADNRSLRSNGALIIDLTSIGVDACAGVALAIWLFATPASASVIALGATAAIVPDPLQFVHSVYPQEPLVRLQRFHEWIHAKRKLAWKLGVSSQVAFEAAVTVFASAMR
ncbi:hypothetical protein [Bradyrhizobium cajani]|uniref:Metal-dependent hydrolase n=1 Tax=Bradyrhizobium cajani TaxID=1928661 RepID=A0A844TGQ2_9BRAD|nr:hypothetical protein [Bradyrhizobium cajani]MCP3373832.1 hypothetical protein [Bradyrhizobium cajani]MVT78148.1 hypothetical protein [Bradyrhizobium cajani]